MLRLKRSWYPNLDSILKSRDITLPTKVHIVKPMIFPVVMYDVRVGPWRKLSTKELMILTYGVGEDSWESLGQQGDQTSQSWRKSVLNSYWKVDAVIEAPILWPPNVKNSFTGKDPDAGKDWRWKERGMTEDEMVRWHHRLNGHQFEQILGIGQGSLACCSSQDRRVRHNWATKLSRTENNNFVVSDNMQRLKKSWYSRLLWRWKKGGDTA